MTTGSQRTYSIAELGVMLSKSVGDDVALETVMRAAKNMGLPPGDIAADDALRLFAVVAEGEGVVAIAARFVRSRLIAQFSREALEGMSSK